ncbi:16S rRNA (cytosine967-C5)-methyltransferase [Sporobacter termitidis DSM 10068]|uniref:16S rRNA (cytosine(967)-C(5))-methyltransferase n=1 Tax=Sporobacter termitidis DSM 10068 TaxID=1123282 RepID=A0A1M5THF7_9FIRM|nr:16S rRNA (cytosine(967)-C(5))-methyltransferase RsmB [Sporobacter termitidis]SHH50154.1 16S rRNA (cytosine967-C5)-methyltransferase [Sporobacter termitidis DSM 10068]
MPVSAREAALKALTRYRRAGAYTDAALDAVLLKERPDSRDAALCTRIFYGVVQNSALIDHYIASFSTVRPSRMEPQVLDILRLSVYQLVFLSKIPVNAAVSEGVELVKKHANPRAAGLVNAVLRKIAQNLEQLPEVTGADTAEKLALQYSHPEWLVRAFIDRLGPDGAEALLKADNSDAGVTALVNTLKADTESVLGSLRLNGVEAAAHPWLPNCVVLRNTRNIERLDAFRNGRIYVQDAAAALAVQAAAPAPGMFVLDGCAAPGGKSFTAAAAMHNSGRILSCDIHEKKLARVSEGAARLGFGIIETRVLDATAPEAALYDSADVVIADVPCSGFGVIRKKPEIRYKKEEDTAGLPELQRRIADNLSKYVKPGGLLVYSTCTLLRRENEDVAAAFLSDHDDFYLEPFALPGPVGDVPSGMTTLWPQETGTDGFFICKLRRRP